MENKIKKQTQKVVSKTINSNRMSVIEKIKSIDDLQLESCDSELEYILNKKDLEEKGQLSECQSVESSSNLIETLRRFTTNQCNFNVHPDIF